MNLDLPVALAARYTSKSQMARVVTEAWATHNLYCVACRSDELRAAPPNTRAFDFQCPECGQRYQLKSRQGWSEERVVDAAYEAMVAAIRSDATPNLVVMQYSSAWRVQNVLLVPRFFFTESIIEKRNPLGPRARRAGWVGCNILLREVPTEGKLRLVTDEQVLPRADVRFSFLRLSPLAQLEVAQRGWTLDVLRVVQRLDKAHFSLADVYQFEHELAELHPDNHNVRPKIRQQLQTLRDLGLIEFRGRGEYVLRREGDAPITG